MTRNGREPRGERIISPVSSLVPQLAAETVKLYTRTLSNSQQK